MKPRRTSSPEQRALVEGWRSGLEERFAAWLRQQGVAFEYEPFSIKYHVEEDRRYTPDFVLPNGRVLETKGRWVTADRKKIRLIKTQHPDLDLRIIFSNEKTRISKLSETTYAEYCDRLGIPHASWPHVPEDWLR